MTHETERLIMRPWQDGDAEALFRYAKDPRVGTAAGWRPHTDVQDSLQVIRTVLFDPDDYAVILKTSGEPVGCVGLMMGQRSNLPLPDGECEIGYWLGVPFWGMGLIPEAVREILRYAFSDLKLNKAWGGYFEGNLQSRRVFEKCGFTEKYVKQSYLAHTGETRTEHVVCLESAEWSRGIPRPARRRLG